MIISGCAICTAPTTAMRSGGLCTAMNQRPSSSGAKPERSVANAARTAPPMGRPQAPSSNSLSQVPTSTT